MAATKSASKPASKVNVFRRFWNSVRSQTWISFTRGNMDTIFLALVMVLLVFGMAMLFSASYADGLLDKNDAYFHVKKQLEAAVAGLIFMFMISFLDYRVFKNKYVITFFFWASCAILLFTSFFGDVNPQAPSAHRWINIGSFSLQPSEVVKPLLIIYLAYLLTKDKKLHSFKFKGISVESYFLLVPIGFVCANMVLQRHISALLIMGSIFASVVIFSGMKWENIFKLGTILAIFAVAALVLYITVIKKDGLDYITSRINSMGSVKDGEINDETWQTMQSLIAIGSGGWFGMGFLESRQKYLWLPESQNDFIISVIVEELGFVGGIAVMVLFILLIARGIRIAQKAPDKFGLIITAGIIFQIGVQFILNVAVACNVIPNTGISLPFFSSGGTALAIQLAEMGIVLSVSRTCENI